MERLGHRTPVHAAQPVRLRDLGYEERWLQDWPAADPTRLGLGQVVVVAQELTHAHGGSLDILAADGDTYYSIEVQLGEVDASHGFRVLDYRPATAPATPTRPTWPRCWWRAPTAASARPCRQSPNTCP